MDIDRVNVLLQIAHRVVGLPELNHIQREALRELREINESLVPKPVEPKAIPSTDGQVELPLKRI